MYSSNCQSIRNSPFPFNHHNVEQTPRPMFIICSVSKFPFSLIKLEECSIGSPVVPIPFFEYRLGLSPFLSGSGAGSQVPIVDRESTTNSCRPINGSFPALDSSGSGISMYPAMICSLSNTGSRKILCSKL
jgi:hypothetical protein